MKVDVERFAKQLDALAEQAFDLGWKKKAFTKTITDRIEQAWFNKQMTESQVMAFGGVSEQNADGREQISSSA